MDDSNSNNEGFGIWVPAEVVQHPDLTLAEKFCFGVISALDKGKGFWMKNESLASLVGISPTYASICIRRLKDFGLVTVEQVPGGRRTVACVDRTALRKPTSPTLPLSTTPPSEIHKAPLVKTTRPTHNTREDNTSVIKQGVFEWQDTGLFTKAWNEWEEYRRQMKAKLTPASVTKQQNFIAANSKSEADAVAIIENSIRNGWRGLFPLNGSATTTTKANHPSSRINYKDDGLS